MNLDEGESSFRGELCEDYGYCRSACFCFCSVSCMVLRKEVGDLFIYFFTC